MKDFLGREIKAGDTVVYPVRRGSNMWMSRMEVQGTEGDKVTGLNPEGRRVSLSNLKNIVVVPAPATDQA